MMRGKQMRKIVNRLLIHIINYIKNKIYEEICSARETNQTTSHFVRQQHLKSTEKSEKKILTARTKNEAKKNNENNFDERIHMALSEYDSRFHVVSASLNVVQRVHSRSRAYFEAFQFSCQNFCFISLGWR